MLLCENGVKHRNCQTERQQQYGRDQASLGRETGKRIMSSMTMDIMPGLWFDGLWAYQLRERFAISKWRNCHKETGCTRLLWERGFSKAIQLVAMHYEVTFSLCRKVSYISRVHGRSTNLVADSSSIRPSLKIIGFPTHCLRTRGCNLPYDSYNASHSERS
jgi:hypothetical protein